MNNQNQRWGMQMWQGIVFSAALLLSAATHAQTVIESVVGSTQGGAEIVRIDLSKELTAAPVGFAIQSPARIALDFPGVTSAMGRSTVDMNQGNLKSVSVVQAGDRTRVVLNLKTPVGYRAEIQGKSLLIVLDSAAQATPVAPINASFAETRTRDSAPLKDLDFRKSADGAGRVVVTLPNNQVGVDIRQQGQTLVVEFMNSTLPEGLRRRLDVADFGTPIKLVTTTQVGDRVRMVIEPTGNWEHSAYQSDEQFVVEVKEIKTDPKKLTQGVGYTGQKLSLNFQNIEVRSLLQVIADFTNFNIVTSDSVSGAVTLRLQDVPWDQALDIILQAKGLGVRKSGNVLWVAPKDEIAAKEKLELESIVSTQSLEPVRTQSFQINYAKATEIAAQLAAGGIVAPGSVSTPNARLLSPRGSVIAIARTNQLFVTDIPSKLEEIQLLITKIDTAMRQVMVEVRIVEASDGFGKSLGVKFGGADLRAQKGGDGGYRLSGDNRVSFGNTYGDAVASSGAAGVVSTSSNFVNLPAVGVLGATPQTVGFSIFNAAANRFLTLEISALEADSKGKLISSPRLVTLDGQKATIKQGEKIPTTKCSVSNGLSICNPDFVDAALKLEVTPQITPDGGISMLLNISKDSRGQTTPDGQLAINVKNIETRVDVENGGTVAIGGIYEMEENTDEAKVPFFGDLPGVGVLFRNKNRTVAKKELLIFVTPKIVSKP